MYGLLHKCSSEAIIELSRSSNGMGGTPAVIQVLHTWGNDLKYHPHLHCIVSGFGLSPSKELVECKEDFLFPLPMLKRIFRGKFLSYLNEMYISGSLKLPKELDHLHWLNLMDKLYSIEWCPYIKETFNGNGNAIDYLGRYTYRVAISNSRIKEVTDTHVTFSAYDYKTGTTKDITLTLVEFIRRYLMHVLPKGFQKIRYYGLLNNRFKSRNLELLQILRKRKLREAILKGLKMEDKLKYLWDVDVSICPKCKGNNLKLTSRTFPLKL